MSNIHRIAAVLEREGPLPFTTLAGCVDMDSAPLNAALQRMKRAGYVTQDRPRSDWYRTDKRMPPPEPEPDPKADAIRRIEKYLPTMGPADRARAEKTLQELRA